MPALDDTTGERLVLSTGKGSVTLPIRYLRRHFPRENRGEVLIVEGDRLAIRAVDLEPESREGAGGGAGKVTVRSGLKEGDRVVVSDGGVNPVGTRVRAREVTSP